MNESLNAGWPPTEEQVAVLRREAAGGHEAAQEMCLFLDTGALPSAKAINWYLKGLRGAVAVARACSCEFGCRDRIEMRERHGLPDKFAVSVYAAVPAFVRADEAEAAISRYRREYAAAPESRGGDDVLRVVKEGSAATGGKFHGEF